MCLDPFLYYLGVVVFSIMVMFVTLIWGSMFVLKSFPTSKMSGWIRKHIITDEDLEQP